MLERIGRHEGISFRTSTQAQRRASSSEDATLEGILNASGVRSRRVALKSNQRWWLSDSGAMLASYKQNGTPVALIPGVSGRYMMVDPHTSRSVQVNARRAALLDGTAYFCYCPLPDERTSNAASLLEMVFNRVWSDFARLVGAGILSGLAMLAPAVFLGAIASQVLPSGDLAALMMLTAAMVLGRPALALAQMVKGTAEQTAPIPAERPRRSIADAPVLELQGELRIDHVSSRHTEEGALVLQDVSIYARTGEFIALVRESGSGKSTLLRLALGLESHLSGAVYYDGHDLERLNRQALRNGVGTVAQDASLRPQTVLDNIIGTGNDLTVEDAWRAARLASVDRDIGAMPTGMYTITSEGSTAFSGGQAQRIMLAGALVRNPRVILLDEATNWLDNETQSRVMEQIEKLSVTRIVSAHRLSTVRRADRIYVSRNGQVIQQGSFDELMAEQGTFRDMALRQMA